MNNKLYEETLKEAKEEPTQATVLMTLGINMVGGQTTRMNQ